MSQIPTAPEWAMVLPAGPEIVARDGRRWTYEVATVVSAFRANNGPLPVDWEHSQDKVAPTGRPAPAAGWIVDMEGREGALWVKVEWTERAAHQIAQGEYRFLSGSLHLDAKSRTIIGLAGAALVNRPALYVEAIRPLPGAALPVQQAAELARDARAYQAEQSALGNHITIMEAVSTVSGRDAYPTKPT